MKLIFRTKSNRYVEVRSTKTEDGKNEKRKKRKLYWIKLFGGRKSEV